MPVVGRNLNAGAHARSKTDICMCSQFYALIVVGQDDPTISDVAFIDLKAKLSGMRKWINVSMHPDWYKGETKVTKSRSGSAADMLMKLKAEFLPLFKRMRYANRYLPEPYTSNTLQEARLETFTEEKCNKFDLEIFDERRNWWNAYLRSLTKQREMKEQASNVELLSQIQTDFRTAKKDMAESRGKARSIVKAFLKDTVDAILQCPFPVAELYGEMFYLLRSIQENDSSEYLAKSIILARSASAKAGRQSQPFLRKQLKPHHICRLSLMYFYAAPEFVDANTTGYKKPRENENGTPMEMITAKRKIIEPDNYDYWTMHRAIVYPQPEHNHVVALDREAYEHFCTAKRSKDLVNKLGTNPQWHYPGEGEYPTFEDPMSSEALPYHLREHFNKVIVKAHDLLNRQDVRRLR